MNSVTTLAIILCVAAVAVSAFRYSRARVPRWLRVSLISIRCLAFGLILLAFIEPLIVIERLPSPNQPIPVLIDVSASMALFEPHKNIDPFLRKITQRNLHHKESLKFAWFLFGDSTRGAADPGEIRYTDRKSFFPESFDHRQLKFASRILIISDGNWSNARLSRIFTESEKALFYLPLPSPQLWPYLEFTAFDSPPGTPADTPAHAGAVIEGIAGHSRQLDLRLSENGRLLAQRKIVIDSGYFKDTINFDLPVTKPGRHLYKLSAELAHDSLRIDRGFIHQVYPGAFTYRVHGPKPTLDKRFLTLALNRSEGFKLLGPNSTEKADFVVIFGWDSHAQRYIDSLKHTGILFFAGCLPCSAALNIQPQHISYHASRAATEISFFEQLDIASLPPLKQLSSCKGTQPLTHRRVLLSGLVEKGNQIDTIPFFATGRFRNTEVIALSATGFWAWDFWPLSRERTEEASFAFSDRLVALLRETLYNNLSREFFCFAGKELFETDSLQFRTFFPSDIPISSPVKIRFRISSSHAPLRDTSLVVVNSGSPRQTIKLAPLPAGDYSYKATAIWEGRSLSFADSIKVGRDRSELLIRDQNRSMLNEIARPIDQSDSAVFTVPGDAFHAVARTQKEIVQIRQSWFLLGAVLLLFGSEWLLRRRFALD